MALCDIKEVEMTDIEDYSNIKSFAKLPKTNTVELYQHFTQSNTKVFEPSQVTQAMRLALREVLWFRIQGKNGFYIHFGYDYYMYIGSEEACIPKSDLTTELFVDKDFASPYFDNFS